MSSEFHPNDPALQSFIEVGSASHFPIQNLPYGVFSTPRKLTPRVGVAIGDLILDLSVIEKAGLLELECFDSTFAKSSLNAFMALGPSVWSRTRRRISQLLQHDNPELRDNEELRAEAFDRINAATLHLPIVVAGYTDFYSSKEHATNVGVMFRGAANALQANWLHIPIGYNGRASTVVVSGTAIHRPKGQVKPTSDDPPRFGPTARLDFELELAAIVGQSSEMGSMLTEQRAEEMIFGFALLNDWSARDIQQWEYVPLGPFQGKAFGTSLSPWIVTREALEPFRVSGPVQTPAPLLYLQQAGQNNYDIQLVVDLVPAGLQATRRIAQTNFSYMYWSPVQQLMHHASSGCSMQIGDVLGSGTISGPDRSQCGSILEITWNGAEPLDFGNGVFRSFLRDGDNVCLSGWCQGDGYRIGFGEVEGTILPPRDA